MSNPSPYRTTGIKTIDYTSVEEYLDELNENHELELTPFEQLRRKVSKQFNSKRLYSITSIRDAVSTWMTEHTMPPEVMAVTKRRMFGGVEHHTAETKAKIRAARLGKHFSAETRMKMSKSAKIRFSKARKAAESVINDII